MPTHIYNEKQKNDAFSLFCSGLTFHAIEKKFGGYPKRTTLKAWADAGKWEERKKNVLDKSAQVLDEDMADIIARQHKIIKALLAKALPSTLIKLEREGANVGDIKRLLEHELLLEGKPTERMNIGVDANWEEVIKLAREKL